MITEHRRQYLPADAMVFTIEAMNRLPAPYRPEKPHQRAEGNIERNDPGDLSLLQSDARRLVNALLGSRPFR